MIGRTSATSHPGRKRRRNEDSFVCEPPLFAVADGMGGAQAGALASRLAAGVLRGNEAEKDQTVEERIVQLVHEANRRVYERAAEDEGATGMGTTMTIAIVDGDRVVIGHVGDSRAYLLRDGSLEQLTEDHSLVAELVRSGKLSPEEADSHPQRSVITRALGPDPDVDVDTFEVETRPGDVFVICSDGLSTMVGSDEIVEIIDGHRDDLDAATRELIEAANRAGGEDNITVVCFDIVGADEATAVSPIPTAVTGRQELEEEEDEDTLDELADVPAASITTIRKAPTLEELEAEREAARRADRDGERTQPRERRTRRRRPWVWIAVVVALLGIAVVAGLWAMSRAHFVGADDDGRVTVYQGLPYDLVGGVRLYRAVYVSPVLAGQLRQEERRELFDHDLESKSAALASVRRFEQEVGFK